MQEVESARRRFEDQWGDLRRDLSRKLGWAPRRSGWWILTLAGAVGLAMGLELRRRRSEQLDGGSKPALSRRAGGA